MKIASYDEGVTFNLYNELISELATYGVIAKVLTVCVRSAIRSITIASCKPSNRL